MFWIQIRTDVLSALILIQTVCKGYQQTSNFAASKERVTDPTSGPAYKTFSCSTQLSMKFILLINVKMPTVVWHFNIYGHDKYNI